MSTSYRPMVKTSGDRDWVGNALRYATAEEAQADVDNLAMRWFAVNETHVGESDDPVNRAWVEGRSVAVAAAVMAPA